MESAIKPAAVLLVKDENEREANVEALAEALKLVDGQIAVADENRRNALLYPDPSQPKVSAEAYADEVRRLSVLRTRLLGLYLGLGGRSPGTLPILRFGDP